MRLWSGRCGGRRGGRRGAAVQAKLLKLYGSEAGLPYAYEFKTGQELYEEVSDERAFVSGRICWPNGVRLRQSPTAERVGHVAMGRGHG